MKTNRENYIYVLIRSWKSFDNFDRCIDSVLEQHYSNYKILFVDDASNYSAQQKKHIKDKLRGHIVVFNKIRNFSLKNGYYMIHKYAHKKDAIVFNLDGDDWLIDRNTFRHVSDIYNSDKNIWLTWGGCLVWNGTKLTNISQNGEFCINGQYPRSIIKNNTYRTYPFLPLHPRTWKVSLFKKIKMSDFKDTDGNWLRFPEDQAMFYPMLEMSNGHHKVIKRNMYVYNMEHCYSIVNKYPLETMKEELIIRRKKHYVSTKK